MIGKLGKSREVPDHLGRTLKLANYLEPAGLPRLPLYQAWSPAVSRWTFGANDEVGCCTFTAAAHAVQSWTSNNSRPVVISDADILTAYSAISGYDGTPESDVGATALAALKHWRTHGVGGHKILVFAEIDPRDHATIMHAIRLFGGVYLGLLLPTSAQREMVWNSTGGEPNSWGGHAVWCTDYDPHSRRIVTWGGTKRMTPEFLRRYGDGAFAIIAEDWLGPDLTAPNGLKLHELLHDLGEVTR